ncbi:hypothetical protein ACMGDH_09375 [Sphingomonas sp. DT-207]
MAKVAIAKPVFDIQFAMFFPLLRAARPETLGNRRVYTAYDITFAQSGNKIYIEPMRRATSFYDAAMRHLRTIRDGFAAWSAPDIQQRTAPSGHRVAIRADHARARLQGAKNRPDLRRDRV